ncbi:hypothetical protein BD626DRAFT_482861 [Schizophyllum amplum]|uniref:Uncharacterized protein n=1 Tax=Schizophyllum amplum TaxID=97359 RepID=A0A550CP28_9AGAR|nr:hypothetical protein BD626DRAFT_482861 [Auriculariopsis ampla]
MNTNLASAASRRHRRTARALMSGVSPSLTANAMPADTNPTPAAASWNPVLSNPVPEGTHPMVTADFPIVAPGSNPAFASRMLMNAAPTNVTPTETATSSNTSLTIPALGFLGLGAALVGSFVLYFACKYARRGIRRYQEKRSAKGVKDVEEQESEEKLNYAHVEQTGSVAPGSYTPSPDSFAPSLGTVVSQADFTDARAQVWFGRMQGVGCESVASGLSSVRGGVDALPYSPTDVSPCSPTYISPRSPTDISPFSPTTISSRSPTVVGSPLARSFSKSEPVDDDPFATPVISTYSPASNSHLSSSDDSARFPSDSPPSSPSGSPRSSPSGGPRFSPSGSPRSSPFSRSRSDTPPSSRSRSATVPSSPSAPLRDVAPTSGYSRSRAYTVASRAYTVEAASSRVQSAYPDFVSASADITSAYPEIVSGSAVGISSLACNVGDNDLNGALDSVYDFSTVSASVSSKTVSASAGPATASAASSTDCTSDYTAGSAYSVYTAESAYSLDTYRENEISVEDDDDSMIRYSTTTYRSQGSVNTYQSQGSASTYRSQHSASTYRSRESASTCNDWHSARSHSSSRPGSRATTRSHAASHVRSRPEAQGQSQSESRQSARNESQRSSHHGRRSESTRPPRSDSRSSRRSSRSSRRTTRPSRGWTPSIASLPSLASIPVLDDGRAVMPSTSFASVSTQQSYASDSTQQVIDAFPSVPGGRETVSADKKRARRGGRIGAEDIDRRRDSEADDASIYLAYDRTSRATVSDGDAPGSPSTSGKARRSKTPSTPRTRRAMTLVGTPRTPRSTSTTSPRAPRSRSSPGRTPRAKVSGNSMNMGSTAMDESPSTPRAGGRRWDASNMVVDSDTVALSSANNREVGSPTPAGRSTPSRLGYGHEATRELGMVEFTRRF